MEGFEAVWSTEGGKHFIVHRSLKVFWSTYRQQLRCFKGLAGAVSQFSVGDSRATNERIKRETNEITAPNRRMNAC